MGIRIGIIGLPNVGKSTLFNALTGRSVESANFPFTTIDPNVGVVSVPDERLDKLAKVSKSAKITPTTIEFVDIAGLVKGAHRGEGLGNQFLSHIRQVDAIAHVVRFFEDKDIQHIHGTIDPHNDAEIIRTELELADLATIERMKEKGSDKKHEVPKLANKPVLYIANLNEKQAKDPANAISDFSQRYRPVLPLNIKLEQELTELPETERKFFLREYGLSKSGLSRLIQASYQLLNLTTFFTTGPKETRAWTVERGASVLRAAGKIHSDMERGFIRAEVIAYEDLVAVGSYAVARSRGLLREEGREYIVRDGDVMLFKFSAPRKNFAGLGSS